MTNEIERKAMRIAIAQDVLDTIEQRKITSGCYMNDMPELPNNENAQKYIEDLECCRVCALGSCLISYVKKFNNVQTNLFQNLNSVNHTDRRKTILKTLDCFDEEQLEMIEVAFETSYPEDCTKNEKTRKAKAFGYSFFGGKARLAAIMENILENDGTFVPV